VGRFFQPGRGLRKAEKAENPAGLGPDTPFLVLQTLPYDGEQAFPKPSGDSPEGFLADLGVRGAQVIFQGSHLGLVL